MTTQRTQWLRLTDLIARHNGLVIRVVQENGYSHRTIVFTNEDDRQLFFTDLPKEEALTYVSGVLDNLDNYEYAVHVTYKLGE